jgi:hypothetical protein
MESAGNVLATTAGKETMAESEKEGGLAIVDTTGNRAARVEGDVEVGMGSGWMSEEKQK